MKISLVEKRKKFQDVTCNRKALNSKNTGTERQVLWK